MGTHWNFRICLGGDVGRLGLSAGVVGGDVKTDMVSRGDHGGGEKKSRRCQRGKQVD